MSHGWKFLTSKIHQPLPLDRRESQKLLAVLNNSFQRHLDRQYPQGLAGSEHSPDDHFDSLLKSPLFGTSRAQHMPSSYRNDGIGKNEWQFRDLKFALEEPVEYFRQQVSAGTATLDSATLALINSTKKAWTSAALDPNESMKASGIGSVMVNWLWSSGQYERFDFIKDRAFVAKLMPFLVVEGQYKPVWDWLQRLRNLLAHGDAAAKQANPLVHKDTGHLLRCLAISEVRYGQGLQSAMQMFMTSHSSMRLSSPAPSVAILRRVYASAGQSLVWYLAHGSASAKVDDIAIEDFSRSIPSWTSIPRQASHQALIQLSHPRKPDTALALQLLSTIQTADSQIHREGRPTVVRVGLKTVEVLLAQGSNTEAARVMKTLQSKFASELGLISKARIETEEQSAWRSLNLLLAT
ncbi:MAG: hypothetical protein Q9218_005712 [Villophora microphyllina]